MNPDPFLPLSNRPLVNHSLPSRSLVEEFFRTFLKIKRTVAVFFQYLKEIALRGIQRSLPSMLHRESGLVTRYTTGEEISTRFESLVTLSDDEIQNYQAYDVVAKLFFSNHPINAAEAAMVKELYEKGEIAEKQYQRLSRFYENIHGTATRQDFNLKDWQAFDKACFELTRQHFILINKVFNDGYENANAEAWNERGINWREAIIAETLAKSLAFIQDCEGKTIEIPVWNPQLAQYQLVLYSIEKTYLGDRLPCYFLSSTAPYASPWFLARGTQTFNGGKNGVEFREGAQESVFADVFDARGVGNKAVLKSLAVASTEHHRSLIDIFASCSKGSVKLAGHSLGGYFANHVGIEFGEKVDKVYGFNAPGIDMRTWERYEQQGSGLCEKFVNFVVQGDFVSASGDKLIGHCYAINDPNNEDYLHAHGRIDLVRPGIVFQKVDVERENRRRARKIAEGLRRNIGRMVRASTQLFRRDVIPEWWSNRDFYRDHYFRRINGE